MSQTSILIFVAFLIVLVLGLPNPAPPERKPGYCHDFGADIKEGEIVSAPIGHCAQLMCINATKNSVSALPCGLIAAPHKDCKLVGENRSKPYPECCATFICEHNN